MTSTAIPRSAILLGLASLILPGAGQVLQRRYGRALLLILLAAALWYLLALGYLVHLWAAFDAALHRRR
ncbi:hypothetical protein Pla163_16750 [Planctomycetes bacterium Pla163]|uniref:TM2 domain protein n=1 Tax=Rohdeia mirabilis TaxID=2528008 RepID=A0A518CZA8_9BACT|nr:hypothetical protein Pla163_16750 [Planctomycetes bacterium Pla163]